MKGSRFLRFFGVALAVALLAVAIPATAVLALSGTMTLSANAGAPGTLVTVSGTGYTASTTFQVIFNGSAITGAASTGNGTFATQFQVPLLPRGSYPVTLTTGAGDTTTQQTFVITPTITLSATSGYVGDQVTVTGWGFSASTTIIIYFDSTAVLQTTTNTAGQIVSGVFTVPQTYAITTNHTITVADVLGSITAAFAVLPKMTASPTAGAVGDTITVSGTGYGPSQAVTVYFDGVSVATSTTSSVGTVASIQFTVPQSTRGNHSITMTDAYGYTYTVTFATSQKATITPTTGPGGTKVTVSGTGFTANSAITITFDDVATNAPATNASGTGSFGPVTFDIPASSAGSHTIKVSDGTNVDTKTFAVTSTATITPTSGFVGSKFTVNATGFLANASISINFGDTLAKTVTSAANGSFSVSVDVPAKPAGTYQVRITDGTNTITVNYAITTTVSINPVTSAGAPGSVGQQITVSGVGFISGRTVTVTYDGQSVATGTVGADNTFSVTFSVPASKAGSHSITVSDGLNSLPLTFVMEGNAPPIPALLKPDNGGRGNGTPTFSWTPVSDPSGVVYNLQVASSQDFSQATILLQKTGLTSGQYTVIQAEKLKSVSSKTPYYWRVSAVDGASNTAGYSTPRAFSVGFVLELPTWAVVVLIVIGALIVGLLFFWLGRRAAAKKDIV